MHYPLYTSNQNQYFLHGLADAGYGFLNQDWLANTLDPTPTFRLIVNVTYRIFKTGVIFYTYYALLLGVYMYCTFGIANPIFDLHQSRAKTIAFLGLFLVIHSVVVRSFLAIAIGPEWTYLLEGGAADQRLLGSVFQPSTFGVLLILTIYIYLLRRVHLALLAST